MLDLEIVESAYKIPDFCKFSVVEFKLLSCCSEPVLLSVTHGSAQFLTDSEMSFSTVLITLEGAIALCVLPTFSVAVVFHDSFHLWNNQFTPNNRQGEKSKYNTFR